MYVFPIVIKFNESEKLIGTARCEVTETDDSFGFIIKKIKINIKKGDIAHIVNKEESVK